MRGGAEKSLPHSVTDGGDLRCIGMGNHPNVTYLRILPAVVAATLAYVGSVRASGSAEPPGKTSTLPELVVDKRKHQVLHLVGYVREYSMAATYYDTVFMVREKTVDFMVPALREKNYRGWLSPRVLAARSYYRFTNYEGLDSVSNYFRHNFSWSDLAGIFRTVPVPPLISSGFEVTDTVAGKYSPVAVWKVVGDTLLLDNDLLADRENPGVRPELFRAYSRHVDFTRFKTGFTFTGVEGDETLFADNITKMTFEIDSRERDQNMRRVFQTSDPVYMTTRGELYIIDREYMGVDEAKEWEEEPVTGDDIGIIPSPEAPEMEPLAKRIIERVDSIDFDALKLKEKNDPKMKTMKKFETRKKRTPFTRLREKILGY